MIIVQSKDHSKFRAGIGKLPGQGRKVERITHLSFSIVIRNAHILSPSGNCFEGNVGIQGTTFTAVDRAIATPSSPDMQEIDATGLILLPGVIHPQVHFWEPGLEHKEDSSTASRTCAKGGSPLSWKCPTPDP